MRKSPSHETAGTDEAVAEEDSVTMYEEKPDILIDTVFVKGSDIAAPAGSHNPVSTLYR